MSEDKTTNRLVSAERGELLAPSEFGLHPLDVRAMETFSDVLRTFFEKQAEISGLEREARVQLAKFEIDSRVLIAKQEVDARAAEREHEAAERRHEAEIQAAERKNELEIQAAERKNELEVQAADRAARMAAESLQVQTDANIKIAFVNRGTQTAVVIIVAVILIGGMGAYQSQFGEAAQFIKELGVMAIGIAGAFILGRSQGKPSA